MTLPAQNRTVTRRAADLADAVETYLTSGPFGHGLAVSGTAAAYYRGGAWACAQACGLDAKDLEAEEIPHLESRRRAATDAALRHGMAGRLDEARAALEEYLALRTRAASDPVLPLDRRADDAAAGPGFPRAAAGHWLGDLLLERFDATTTVDGATVGVQPEPVTPQTEAGLVRGIALARRCAPRLADDLFAAVRKVILYRAAQPYSGYTNAAPLFVFVARQMFDQERVAAELLVHECLHQKLNDISVTRSLFRVDYHDAESARITVPWSFGSDRIRYFSADRSFAAFHVYAHQTLLYLGMLATSSEEVEAQEAVDNLLLSWARAAHFARALTHGPILEELGADGHRFVHWLTHAVDDLGAFRLPDGSELSRYTDACTAPQTAASI